MPQHDDDIIPHQDEVEAVVRREIELSGKVELVKIDDIMPILDWYDDGEESSWRWPSLTEAEGYENDPRCYITDGRAYVYGDIIRVGEMAALGMGVWGNFADLAWAPALTESELLRQNGNSGELSLSLSAGPTAVAGGPGWQASNQYGDLPHTVDGDGLIYLSLKASWLLASSLA